MTETPTLGGTARETASVLLIVRAAPASGLRAREALDAALLFSAFVPALSVLFSGDGCWQLLRGMNAGAAGAVPIEPVLSAFDDYDIHALYADATALAARGLAMEVLSVPVQALDDDALQALIARHDHVISF